MVIRRIMKKTFRFATAAAAAILAVSFASVSCSKENLENSDSEKTAPSGKVLTFSASFVPPTKTAINVYDEVNLAKVNFTAGDYICLMAGTQTNKNGSYVLQSPSTQLEDKDINSDGSATFTIDSPSDVHSTYCFFTADNQNCWGTYSFSNYSVETRTRSDAYTSIAAGRVPHLAIVKCASTDRTITFKNVLTLIRYTVTDENVKYVEFSGNNNEGIMGTIKIFYGDMSVTPMGGQETVRSYVSAPGEAGYIALYPGLTLSKGFTIKAFDKDGKTLFVCRSEDEFKTEQNLLVDFGTLDDHKGKLYDWWQAGGDIEINGQVYNKSKYGEGKLVKKGATVTEQSGVFFLNNGASISSSALGVKGTAVFIGNSIDGSRTKVSVSETCPLYGVTKAVFKNLEIETPSSAAVFSLSGQVDTLLFEGCKINQKNVLWDMSGKFTVEHFTLKDSEIVLDSSLSEGNAALITSGSATDEATRLKNYTFSNNIFYAPSAREYHIIKSDGADSGLTIDKLTLDNNSFYNLYSGKYGDASPKAFVMLGVLYSSVSLNSNLVYTGYAVKTTDVVNDDTPTAYLVGFYLDSDAGLKLSAGTSSTWYGTLETLGGAGFHPSATDSSEWVYVRTNMTSLTEDPYSAIDPATGTYTLKANYTGFGATR